MNSTPLLISSETGLSEYLKNNKNCYLFLPELDSIIAVFEKVENNFIDYKCLSTNARQSYLDNFSMDQYVRPEHIVEGH